MNKVETRTIAKMIGVTFDSVTGERGDSEMLFSGGSCVRSVRFYREQDCCETVEIEDICGDLEDLAGSPIVEAVEVTSYDREPPSEYTECYTWTFYRFSTIKGTVTVRWLGESNGYYSESVDVAIDDGLGEERT